MPVSPVDDASPAFAVAGDSGADPKVGDVRRRLGRAGSGCRGGGSGGSGAHTSRTHRAGGRACRARAASGSARANDASMPTAASVTTSALPPAEMNGSGRPVIGRSPTTPPMLISAWATSQVVIAVAASRPAADEGDAGGGLSIEDPGSTSPGSGRVLGQIGGDRLPGLIGHQGRHGGFLQ